ncbi:MAG: nucleotidyltransferase [Phycisphaerae bacterium]
MDVNPDYKDLLKELNARGVKYVVIGTHALIYYTEPRFTKDLDVWVEPTRENAQRIYEALKAFGAPLRDVGLEDFADPQTIYQIGISPCRIDIVMGVSGVKFPTAWRNKKQVHYGDIRINILSSKDLLRNKKASGRPQDISDAYQLQNAVKFQKQARKQKQNLKQSKNSHPKIRHAENQQE